MKKKEEIKHLDKQWKEINSCLKAFLTSGNQEQLHKFRVQIKKVKAMLSLLEGTSKQHNLLKTFKPINKIFKYAGHIRDAHTNLELGQRYNLKNELFENSQKKIIEDGTIRFKHKGKQYVKKINDTCKQLKKQLSPVDNTLITEYYKKQLEYIAGNMASLHFTEHTHTSRKLMKILMYNHQLADKALQGTFCCNTAYLDKMQNSIGQWHDNVVAAQLFNSAPLNDKLIATQINRKNAWVKRRITLLADNFYKKATMADDTVKAKSNTNGN